MIRVLVHPKVRLFALGLSVLICGAVSVMFGQMTGTTRETATVPMLDLLKSSLPQQAKPTDLGESIGLDAPVIAKEYVVGPGDRLLLSIWAPSPVTENLVVSPEGLIVIPGVQIVDVRGATLAQAKERVIAAAGQKFRNVQITLTLTMPRKVTVTILGSVPTEGRKTVRASQRVDDVIELANEIPTGRLDVDQYESKMDDFRRGRSERKIVLQHRTGERQMVDLPLYRATGAGRLNPYLQEGDIIFVPIRTEADNLIAIYGGAIQHARFEFVEGDSLSHLIGMGMGFDPQSDPAHAVLYRLDPAGTRMDSLAVDARAVADHRVADVALRPGDRLVIPRRVIDAGNFSVTIEGEVARPGTYPVTRDRTTLRDVIMMAGGTTARANLNAAQLYRMHGGEMDLRAVTERERLLSLRASPSLQDTSYYQLESALRLKGELVVVDFRKLLQEGKSSADVSLRPFDRIVIPEILNTVYVFGQVRSPGHIKLERGAGYRHYIDIAGGYTESARSGDVMVIKQGTRAWLDPDETEIEDGDMVWVPKDREYPFSHYVTIYAQVAGIVGTIATIALLINSLK